MEDIILAFSVSFVAFLSTSVDNLFLLVTLSLHPKYGTVKVRLGYLLAIMFMLTISLVLAQSVQLIPTGLIPYIGFIPLAIGLYELYRLVSGGVQEDALPEKPIIANKGTIWTIAIIMLTHSWDSIGVLAPLFADTRVGLLPWMAISVLMTGVLLIFLGQWVVSHPKVKQVLARVAPRVLPFLLIGVGIYILTNTPTDVT